MAFSRLLEKCEEVWPSSRLRRNSASALARIDRGLLAKGDPLPYPITTELRRMHARFHREAIRRHPKPGTQQCGLCPRAVRSVPVGFFAINCFWKSLPITPRACTPSVSVPQGLMELTRMFLGPSSLERTRVTESTPLFVAR
jgi:hypothetical protein